MQGDTQTLERLARRADEPLIKTISTRNNTTLERHAEPTPLSIPNPHAHALQLVLFSGSESTHFLMHATDNKTTL